MYGHHKKQSKDQVDKVTNPAHGQLNRKMCFPLPLFWSRETSSAVPSRVSLLILRTQAESGTYPRDFSRFPWRRTYIYTSTDIEPVPSLSDHAIIAFRWRSLPRVWRRRASSPQGSFSSGCSLFRYHHIHHLPVLCVFFPFILDVKFVGCTSRGHTGGRSHRISHPPSFCDAYLYFSREKDSAINFPRRPLSRILCSNDLIALHLLSIHFYFYFLFFIEEKA